MVRSLRRGIIITPAKQQDLRMQPVEVLGLAGNELVACVCFVQNKQR